MDYGNENYNKAQTRTAKKQPRRRTRDDDPTQIRECWPGDVIEVPFLGVCEFAFFIGRSRLQGFLRNQENNPVRHLWSVPGWVPVVCVTRYRKNERD